jgi:hypothetical protein
MAGERHGMCVLALSHLELNVARNTQDELNFVEACLQQSIAIFPNTLTKGLSILYIE